MEIAMALNEFMAEHQNFAVLLQLFVQLSPVVVVALLALISSQLRKLNKKK